MHWRRRRRMGWFARSLGVALVLCAGWAGCDGWAGATEVRSAVVVALDGPIGPGTARYVVRHLGRAQRRDAAVVVLRLDTPGGLVSLMREIIRAMLGSPVPVLAYVAPGGARAASAGTYILYAAGLAAMAPGTNLGAATPVAMFGEARQSQPGGTAANPVDTMTAKVTNDAAAYIRGLAVLHGRNPDWAERAVREAVSLPYDAALKQHVIDVVAADVPDLLAKADGRSVVVQGRPALLRTSGLAIVQVRPAWPDRLLGLLTDPSLVYLLLLAGLLGIGVEVLHPGVFAPGVIGAICLLLGGYGLDLLPVDFAGLALALLGLGLMIAEAFIPAFGSFVLGGGTAFAIGSLLMFSAPGEAPPLGVIASATLISVLLFGVGLMLLLRARRRKVTGLGGLTERVGRAIDWTGQEGEVLVQGERWHARAAGPLHSGEAVRVVGRHGLTLVVEPARQETTP